MASGPQLARSRNRVDVGKYCCAGSNDGYIARTIVLPSGSFLISLRSFSICDFIPNQNQVDQAHQHARCLNQASRELASAERPWKSVISYRSMPRISSDSNTFTSNVLTSTVKYRGLPGSPHLSGDNNKEEVVVREAGMA